MLAARSLGNGVAKRSRSSLFFRHLCSSSSSTDASSSRRQQKRSLLQICDTALVVDALRHFHRQHQHFVVPYSFTTPSSPPDTHDESDTHEWPSHLHGVKLGRAVRRFVKQLNSSSSRKKNAIPPEVHQQLRAIGFPYVADWKKFQWEQMALSALQSFKAIEGHMRVPRKFVVPAGDERFAKPAWGFRLGAHVNQLRGKRKRLEAYQLEALDDLGFVWSVSDDKWENLLLPTLRRFRDLRGHANVPQMFVVPSDDPQWPRELAGFAVGRVVNRIRSDDLYYPQVERYLPELEALGFSFSNIESTWDEKIVPSLQAFRTVHGHCNVGKFFSVPHEEPWPVKAWGLKLGFIVHNIRARGDFFQLVGRDMERLEQLGFVWNTSEAKWRQRILPALKAFVLVHDHASIPRNFIVPSKSPWPTKAWGLDLGRVASDASYQRKYADYIEIERNQLEALGFFWAMGIAQDEDELSSDSSSSSSSSD